jgi:hypothetical protein
VFWWFERKGQFLQCEVLPVSNGGFELRIVDPDGTEVVERFDDSTDLERRQHDVIDEATRDGWSGPHGWNL